MLDSIDAAEENVRAVAAERGAATTGKVRGEAGGSVVDVLARAGHDRWREHVYPAAGVNIHLRVLTGTACDAGAARSSPDDELALRITRSTDDMSLRAEGGSGGDDSDRHWVLRGVARMKDAIRALLSSVSMILFFLSVPLMAFIHAFMYGIYGMWIGAFFNMTAALATATTITIGVSELLGQLVTIFIVIDALPPVSVLFHLLV